MYLLKMYLLGAFIVLPLVAGMVDYNCGGKGLNIIISLLDRHV